MCLAEYFLCSGYDLLRSTFLLKLVDTLFLLLTVLCGQAEDTHYQGKEEGEYSFFHSFVDAYICLFCHKFTDYISNFFILQTILYNLYTF